MGEERREDASRPALAARTQANRRMPTDPLSRPASEAEAVTAKIHGRSVVLREGDLVFSRFTWWSSTLLSLTNSGMSHVATVCKLDGKLCLVSVCSSSWTDAKNRHWPAGVTSEAIDTLNDPAYRHAWLVRPHVPRTQAQTALLRIGAETCRQGVNDAHKYDGMAEFVHTALHLQPATRTRWHCAELAAHLAAGCGAFSGPTESCTLPACARGVGDRYERLF